MAASLPGVGVSLIEGSGAGAPGVSGVLFSLIGANMNSILDQAFTPASFKFNSYMITQITVTQASGALTAAVGGIYTAAGKSGTTIVSASQAYSGITGPTSILPLTISGAGTALLSSQTLFLSLTTALGSAATANIYVIGMAL
jgi:hypothetical protein